MNMRNKRELLSLKAVRSLINSVIGNIVREQLKKKVKQAAK